MTRRTFYLKNNQNQFVNVKFNANHPTYPTKHDYTLYYSDVPNSVWYIHESNENTTNNYIISLKDSCVCYSAYQIEYRGPISLSYNSETWKLTDGLSMSMLEINGNMIEHPINHSTSNILTVV
jgi:hypothetical protein